MYTRLLMKWALKGPRSNAAERSCSHKLLSRVHLQTKLPVSFSTHTSIMTHESPCFDNNTDFWAWTMTLRGPGRKLEPLQSQILLWRLLKWVMQPSQSRSGTIFKVNLSNQNASSVTLNWIITQLTTVWCFPHFYTTSNGEERFFFLKVSFMILNEANIWVKAKQVQKKGFVQVLLKWEMFPSVVIKI